MPGIGLGGPALALVLLMGHGLDKARAVLWSGDLRTGKGPSPADPARPGATVGGLALWLATGTMAAGALALVAGNHGVLNLVVWAALTPLAVGGWSRPRMGLRSWVTSGALLVASLALSFGASWAFRLPDALTSDQGRDLLGLVVAAALFAAGVVSAFSPWLASTSGYRRLYASALHGFGWGRWPEVLASRFLPRSKSQPSGGQ